MANNNNINWSKWRDLQLESYKIADTEKVLENMSFSEDDVKIIKEILETKIPKPINGVLIDIFTAESFSNVYDLLTVENKKDFHSLNMKEAIKLIKVLHKEII